jgi:WD40 repeat protein
VNLAVYLAPPQPTWSVLLRDWSLDPLFIVTVVAWSKDGKYLAASVFDKTVRVWSTDDGRLLQVLSESEFPLLTTAFSPTGEFLAASAEHIVLVWKRTFGSR